MYKIFAAASLSLLSGCATIVNGSSQMVTITTTPPSAACTLDRIGTRLGVIPQTPGSLRIDKSKNDLSVTCSKEGFATASVTKSPRFSGATFGNLLVGGAVGVVIDAASGANYAYPDTIELALIPTGQTVAAGPSDAGPSAAGPSTVGPIVLQPVADREVSPVALRRSL